MSTPVFGVTGWKNSGKTTLLTKLVTEFTRRGFAVATVKHAHHAFDIDQPGTDSFRHREAGAREVMIVSGTRWALMRELRDEPEPPLEAALKHVSPCDLILIEGYKRAGHPKIEVRRQATSREQHLADDDASILAIAADFPTDAGGRPSFDLNDTGGIADFIAATLALKPRNG
ncbi:MAG: molybdopterin-guanine dinucleotide biosynthesis protein B [Propylenella sp.]